MDIIKVHNENGEVVSKEAMFMTKSDDKTYVVYKDIDGNNIYASYYYDEDLEEDEVLNLYNDLTEEEFMMLEDILKNSGGLNDK